MTIPHKLQIGALTPLAPRCIAVVIAFFALSVVAHAQYENTAYGANALSSVTTGDDNAAFGTDALRFDSLGSFNTATGADALYRNTYGGNNTATGFGALFSNTTGNVNTAMGVKALYSNYQGANNSALGYEALYSNTTANNNTAVGTRTMEYNTTGENNTATGSSALFYNTTGTQNTATGTNALHGTFGNGGASYNTATGFESLFSIASGGGNVANGWQALYSNTGGGYNTGVGVSALRQNTTGNQNTAAGVNALYHNNGQNNTAVGFKALEQNTTGNGNVALGYQAGLNLTSGSNNIDIGNAGVAGEANTIRIGKSGIQQKIFIAGISGKTVANGTAVFINGQGQLGTVQSSARYKSNIKPMDKASEAILKLEPVTFRYKQELDPDGVPQFGLIAEQVEKVNPDLVVRDEEGQISTVRYEAVNAMLLNEFIKERQKVQTLEKTIAQQQKDFQAELSDHNKAFGERFAQQQKQIDALTSTVRKVSERSNLTNPTRRLIADNL